MTAIIENKLEFLRNALDVFNKTMYDNGMKITVFALNVRDEQTKEILTRQANIHYQMFDVVNHGKIEHVDGLFGVQLVYGWKQK